jgi:hypothetical protein
VILELSFQLHTTGQYVKFIPSLSDILAVSGLALLGYGLFLFKPWVSYSVCGSLLIMAGYMLGKNERSTDEVIG